MHISDATRNRDTGRSELPANPVLESRYAESVTYGAGGQPSIAAVVLNWRDATQTIACIRSITQDHEVDRIFVVDNEANGELRSALKRESMLTIELIESEENRGFSAGVNLGLEAALSAGYDEILVINNDAHLLPGALALLRLALKSNPDVAIVGPQILNPDFSLQSAGARLNRLTFAIDSNPRSKRLDYLTWACVLLPRRTLELVGLLDERFFMYWEDVDYGFRIRDLGGLQIVVPEAQIVHNISSSHENAGSKILAYSALGLSVFAHKRRGLIWTGAIVRMIVRVSKQTVRRRFDIALVMVHYWVLGRRNSGKPAYSFIARTMGETRL